MMTTSMTRGKLQLGAVRERRDETGVGATIEVAARQERRRCIKRDDDDGEQH